MANLKGADIGNMFIESQYKYDTEGFPGYERYSANYGDEEIHRNLIKIYLSYFKLYLAKKSLEDTNYREKFSKEIFEVLEIEETKLGEFEKEFFLLEMKQEQELFQAISKSKVIETITKGQIDYVFR